MMLLNTLASYLLTLLLIQYADVTATVVVAMEEQTSYQGTRTSQEEKGHPKVHQQRTQQTTSRKLHADSSVAALPSCCYLDCPSRVRTLRTGSYSDRHSRNEHDSRALHRIDCSYNCDACGANCCSCNQVSSSHRSAVEMQCTCTPGCDHHHHFSTSTDQHHHHHTGSTNAEPHHHHFTESHHHHHGATRTYSHVHRD